MATPTQYSVPHKELVEVLIKHLNIHEGRWVLTLSVGFAPGLFGPSEDQVNPGAAVVINHVLIQRETEGQPAPSHLVVDAKVVNPAPEHKKGK
jgi:hypothetical protein